MKPSVIAFWQLPQEEPDLLAKLEMAGPIVAYPSRAVEDRDDLKPRPLAAFIADTQARQLLFGREDQVSLVSIEIREFEGHRLYALTSMSSCLIGYRRGEIGDGKLTLSHLTAYWTRLSDDQSRLEKKDDEFIKWGKRVFSVVRNETPEWHKVKRYRATRGAKKAFLDEGLELIEY